jgi:hypothetical protein
VRAGVRSAVCSGGFRAVLRVLSDAWELEVAVCADSECGVSTIPSPTLDFRCRRRPGCADRPRHGPHSLNQPTSRSSSEPSRAEPSRRRAADPIRVQGCALAQEERHAVGRIAQAPPAGRADRVGTKPRAHLKPHGAKVKRTIEMTPKRPASASCHISAQPSSARQPIRMRAPGRVRGVASIGHSLPRRIGRGAYVRREWPRFQAACEDSVHERVDAAADGAERGGCGRGLEPLRCTPRHGMHWSAVRYLLATRRALLPLRISKAAALRPRRPSGPGADVARASPFAVRMCQGRVGAIRRWTFGGIHRA